MAMLSVEFGGLPELARAVENYRDNINILYGSHDQFTLAPERVLCNIVVAMYSLYIDLWLVSGTCIGHRSLLMYSMLEFAMLIGRYCCREQQLSRHQWVLIDPSDPRLTVEVLIQDPEENQRSAEMDGLFQSAMQLLGDPDGVLYAKPVSMAQYYNVMVAGSRHIGYLPDHPSHKTPEGVAKLYHQERGTAAQDQELFRKLYHGVRHRGAHLPSYASADPGLQGVHAPIPQTGTAGCFPYQVPY